MVHTWISLQNDTIANVCQNKRILRIFRKREAHFYGDYELDIYLGVKNDYKSLEAVIEKVIQKGNGWIRYMKLSDASACPKTKLEQYISDCGWVPHNEFRKMFPRREDGVIRNGYVLRKDGNFIMYACETARYYYVICFATS